MQAGGEASEVSYVQQEISAIITLLLMSEGLPMRQEELD